MMARAFKIGIAMVVALGVFVLSGGPMRGQTPHDHPVRDQTPSPAPPSASSNSSSDSIAPNRTALDALDATAEPLETVGHNVTMRTDGSLSRGSVDPILGTSAVVVTQDTAELDETVVGGTIWVKLNIDRDTNDTLGISPRNWMIMDAGRLDQNNTLPLQVDGSDPIDLPGILAAIRDVTQTDAQHFHGTVDLTRIAGRNTPDPDEVQQAGAAATAVPFTAIADAERRIVRFSVNASEFDPGLSIDVTFSDYGNPSPIATPLSAIAAPDDLYQIFTN
jgi:hypothetical protein